MQHIPPPRFLQSTKRAKWDAFHAQACTAFIRFCGMLPLQEIWAMLDILCFHLPLYHYPHDKLPCREISPSKCHFTETHSKIIHVSTFRSSGCVRRCGRPCGDTLLAASKLPLQRDNERHLCPSNVKDCPSTPGIRPLMHVWSGRNITRAAHRSHRNAMRRQQGSPRRQNHNGMIHIMLPSPRGHEDTAGCERVVTGIVTKNSAIHLPSTTWLAHRLDIKITE